MYVGHTTDKDRRLKEHIRSTETDNTKLYKTIRDTGGWEHWEMIVISSYVCNCKEEALKIEQEWCEKLRPNLNSISPFA
jgi:predicted GIY-YIG superfamily endonuclease